MQFLATAEGYGQVGNTLRVDLAGSPLKELGVSQFTPADAPTIENASQTIDVDDPNIIVIYRARHDADSTDWNAPTSDEIIVSADLGSFIAR